MEHSVEANDGFAQSLMTKDKSMEDHKSEYLVMNHPLLIDEVTDCIFGFLKVRDIKIARQVCEDWRYAGELFLRKQARIGFVLHPPTNPKSLLHFNADFQLSLSDIPFRAVLIRDPKFGPKSAPWPESVLLELVETMGRQITDLRIDFIKFKNEYTEYYNLGHKLKQMPLRKLNINCESQELQVMIEYFPQIKFLKLVNCGLKFSSFTGNEIVSPEECILRACHIVFPPNKGRTINDFINFASTKRLSIMHFDPSNSINMDLSGNFVMDAVDLEGVGIQVFNWNSSNWKVSNFGCAYIRNLAPVSVTAVMDVNYLVLLDCLLAIPERIQYLDIRESHFGRIVNYSSLCLPELKHLDISSNAARYFQNCPSLSTMFIRYAVPEVEIDVNWIPKTVTKLRIHDQVKLRGQGVKKLDKLILSDNFFEDAHQLLAYLQPESTVIMLLEYDASIADIAKDEQDFLLTLQRCKNKSLAIGPIVKPYGLMFGSEALKKLVSNNARYYLFKDGMGTPILESEFDLMTEL